MVVFIAFMIVLCKQYRLFLNFDQMMLDSRFKNQKNACIYSNIERLFLYFAEVSVFSGFLLYSANSHVFTMSDDF
ncbi:hypothetical protein BWD08_03940 [Neisseria animaloris]|nr:hypothetical protein BWD08_03940 [Neisseria animaloris]